MTNIDLYTNIASPPCRAVMLLLAALNIKYNPITVDVMHGEQLKPDFIKMNPLHTIPTINDNGFILYDSHAIMKYLINQYGKDDSFDPKDTKNGALVNQQLFFNIGILWPRFKGYLVPVLINGQPPDESKTKDIEEAFNYLDGFVKDQQWMAGSSLTIADFAIVPVVSTLEATGLDITKFPNLNSWYGRVKQSMANYGYVEINQKGSDMIGGVFKSKLKH